MPPLWEIQWLSPIVLLCLLATLTIRYRWAQKLMHFRWKASAFFTLGLILLFECGLLYFWVQFLFIFKSYLMYFTGLSVLTTFSTLFHLTCVKTLKQQQFQFAFKLAAVFPISMLVAGALQGWFS